MAWSDLHQSCGFSCEKGQNISILNLNNRRLRRLKVHVINQKRLVLMGGNPKKRLNF